MQPTYLYTSDFDKEVRWRSEFSTGVPILLGILQMLLTVAIIGLEIASVIISPILGTLYAGFWCSVIFMLSWISMLGLVCCHRARKWTSFMFFISILCAAAAIALIVLDIFFIRDIDKCFFLNVTCNELALSYFPLLFSQPLGRKVQVLKVQLTCAALMLVTAILYMLLFISTSMAVRRGTSRVLFEHHQLPAQLVGQTSRYSPTSQPSKSTSVPVTYEPSRIECPHCGKLIKLTQKKRYA
ncbi:unnamed protein product [Rotaria sp. Silwood1]|nr:unnamed protein product [Rotaria sp. Silwood1]CAF0893418.1 unnamed protein product [Rotaria sp. Silwood1]CAF0907300.1 unnamed protein product [Rotaria sp. Silwood1]CAF3351892.1 unnamed protein product [Rotaria sp. Silwood1]CAF3390613.1 unnamed protein product [Rotaria sp. Silwood1]